MNDSDYEQFAKLADSIAKEAGVVFKKYFNNYGRADFKDNNSPVTIADKEINSLVISRIKESFPEHDVVGEEESSLENGGDYVWICDPIDGTNPFIYGLPYACFMLALSHKGKIIVAVINDVMSDRLYSATHGGGTFCNGEKLRVNHTNQLSKQVIEASGSISAYVDSGVLKMHVEHEAHRLLVLMCTAQGALQVANGHIGGQVFVGSTLHDMAASSLIVAEAGGKVTDLFGDEQDYSKAVKGMVCSNGLLHDELLAIVKKSLKSDVSMRENWGEL